MNDNKKELIKWLELCKVRGLGSSKMIKLLSIFNDLETIYSVDDYGLLRTRIFNEEMINEFNRIKKEDSNYFEYIIEECGKRNVKIVPFYSKEYPFELKSMPDAPLALFAWGDVSLLNSKKIAIVGSRESSETARKWAFDISQKLAKKRITIVSGGARGIDYEAHRGALSVGGKTISVVGSGLFRLYPKEHIQLYEEIKKKGLIISENEPNDPSERLNLIRRNRIISGISGALILVTSSSEGGSMAQLKVAFKQKVPVFCPKSSLNLLPNEGIKKAVKEYNAREIVDIDPVLKELEKPGLLSYVS